MRDAAAGAAQREGRAHNDRIANFAGKSKRVWQVLHHLRRGNRLTNGEHGVFKPLPIFRFVNGLWIGAQQLYAVLF